ncbi:unnamed protein product [Tilletia controversa]|uniref:Uncharacterized protein n=3 Tax=Tilletia TaxID=13289 RepID=A0A8X7MNG7_9BASI|nr:hypothetical protein CF336_g6078 [Tilletia laevis]KAE8191797.1 hypothetical protein CF328_g5570 [Tilletia controversa]KAE8255525.1 hypothetical protein A4X03_0g5553 [Tilletia caries]KAE8193821.1 hypothetical protein CF335_g5492 [Tilletia laevis]KAE8243032.1 hypothetical protein A4X06_0g6598 [Tilletia controversa]
MTANGPTAWYSASVDERFTDIIGGVISGTYTPVQAGQMLDQSLETAPHQDLMQTTLNDWLSVMSGDVSFDSWLAAAPLSQSGRTAVAGIRTASQQTVPHLLDSGSHEAMDSDSDSDNDTPNGVLTTDDPLPAPSTADLPAITPFTFAIVPYLPYPVLSGGQRMSTADLFNRLRS